MQGDNTNLNGLAESLPVYHVGLSSSGVICSMTLLVVMQRLLRKHKLLTAQNMVTVYCGSRFEIIVVS